MQQATAETVTRAPEPVQHVIRTTNARASVVAKVRELADKLESGELDGIHVQWNDSPTQPAMATVVVKHQVEGGAPGYLRIDRFTFEKLPDQLRVVEG